MLDVAIITVERMPNGIWFARFAESDKFSAEAEQLGTAVVRLIMRFGRDKLAWDLLTTIEATSRNDFRAFRVPLNETGKNALRGDNPYAASKWSPHEHIVQYIAQPAVSQLEGVSEACP